VWHASAAALPGIVLTEVELREQALKVLKGVGDPDMGQWEEMSDKAYHVRRRVTPQEAPGLTVVDVRKTQEALERFEQMRLYLPRQLIPRALEEAMS
jgi:hypothetical protein